MMADEEAARFVGGQQARSGAWRGMAAMAGSLGAEGLWHVLGDREGSGRWVGRLGPWQPEGWPGAEVGWGLTRDAWGKGYATEGSAAAIDWAFDTLGWDDVIHCIAPANTPSARVAERLGSALRGKRLSARPVRQRAGRHLGPDPRAMAGAARLGCSDVREGRIPLIPPRACLGEECDTIPTRAPRFRSALPTPASSSPRAPGRARS